MTRRGLLKFVAGIAATAAFKTRAANASTRATSNADSAQAIPQSDQPVAKEDSSWLAKLKNSVTRIYEASRVPPLPPSEYRQLFTLIAAEIHARAFAPVRTAEAVSARARRKGLKLAKKDISFVLDALHQTSPQWSHSPSPAALARAYRNFVFAKCRRAGVELSQFDCRLIQVWLRGSGARTSAVARLRSTAVCCGKGARGIGLQRAKQRSMVSLTAAGIKSAPVAPSMRHVFPSLPVAKLYAHQKRQASSFEHHTSLRPINLSAHVSAR